MKYNIAALAFLSSMSLSQAALYTLNNGTTASLAAGVQTSEGKVFRSGTTDGTILGVAPQNVQTSAGPGIIAFGFFSTDNFSAATNGTDLVSLFTRFGAVNTFGGASTGGNRSVFSTAQSQTIGTTFNDKSLYFFAGNGATFETSTQFLIAKMDTEKFLVGDDIANATAAKSITITPGNSTALLGSENTNVFTTNTDATQTAGWTMGSLAAVPEPSAALLGAIGALGLLRRRRN